MSSSSLVAAHARCQPHAQRLHLARPSAGVVAVPASIYQDESILREEILAYAVRLGSGDLRAVASVWSKHYVGALVPGVAALMTLEGVGIDAGAADVLIGTKEGRAEAAYVPEPSVVTHQARATLDAEAAGKRVERTSDLHAWVIGPLLHAHLAPLFGTLARVSGLWQGVLWNNVGNSLAWYYDQFALARPAAAREDRAALLEAPTSPMRDPVTYEDIAQHGLDRRVQVRRTCCLRDRIPGTATCYTCPRLSSDARAALLKAQERRS